MGNDFVEKYNKKYETSEEFMDRLKVFTENVKEIEAHNNRRDASWRKGINQFSDLTAQEFKAIHASGLLNVVKRQSDESNNYSNTLKPISDLPESKDWRDEGIIPMLELKAIVDHAGRLQQLSSLKVTLH